MLNKLLNRQIQNYKIKKIALAHDKKIIISQIAKLKIKSIKNWHQI